MHCAVDVDIELMHEDGHDIVLVTSSSLLDVVGAHILQSRVSMSLA